MEHRLILGGEQYLPFARSRIKALKATGQKYASQKFEIDGVSIRVRISDGHEYIVLEGDPKIEIAMDSGVFGLGGIAEMSPATYQDGVLHEYGSVLGYNSNFTEDTEKGPGRWNPNKPSDGQFSGLLRGNGKTFVGNILGQEAFKRPLIPDPDNEGVFIPDEQSELLRIKKITASLCPASVFTGRTRLYVQALYGLPLSKSPNQNPSYVTGLPYELNITGLTQPPSLHLRSAPVKKGESRGPDVLLTTSCGVWLDGETGEHWLFQIADRCYVYPLKLRPALTKLRKHLADGSKLNEQDKRNLEAYLLSQSLPDSKSRQEAADDVSDMYSMGYGWHWNYSGVSASVVEHAYSQWEGNPKLYYTMSSLLTFSIWKKKLPEPPGGFKKGDFTVVWQGMLSRGPQVKWAGYRHVWVFAEPLFGTGVSSKTFPRYHPPLIAVSDIPIYVFYIGDTMKLCRATITFTEEKYETTESEGFSISGGEERTFGMQGGFSRYKHFPAHFDMELSCGDYTAHKAAGVHRMTGNEVVLAEKTNLSWWSYGKSVYYGIVGPPFEYTYVDGTQWRYGWAERRDGMMEHGRQQGAVAEENYGYLVMVVAEYDSQAVFIHSSKTKVSSRSGISERIQYNYIGFNFVKDALWTQSVGGGAPDVEIKLPSYYGFDQIGARNLTRTPTDPYSETETDSQIKSHYVGITTAPCTFTNLGQFFANDLEEVSSSAHAWSGSNPETPVVMADGMQVAPVNSSNVFLPAFTGWI